MGRKERQPGSAAERCMRLPSTALGRICTARRLSQLGSCPRARAGALLRRAPRIRGLTARARAGEQDTDDSLSRMIKAVDVGKGSETLQAFLTTVINTPGIKQLAQARPAPAPAPQPRAAAPRRAACGSRSAGGKWLQRWLSNCAIHQVVLPPVSIAVGQAIECAPRPARPAPRPAAAR